jgi:hypothetical protein
MIAALFVEPDGIYSNLPGIDPWPIERDACRYAAPWRVIAHPPCERWGRFWHGSTRKPHQYALGDDGGAFCAALKSVNRFGGVLEHPADSHAWKTFGLTRPNRAGGWTPSGQGWTCYVEQAHYGHFSRKPTWLYAAHVRLFELTWGCAPQRLHSTALANYGYEKARRIGMMAMVGGKHKTKIRNATPLQFRDLLIKIVETASV